MIILNIYIGFVCHSSTNLSAALFDHISLWNFAWIRSSRYSEHKMMTFQPRKNPSTSVQVGTFCVLNNAPCALPGFLSPAPRARGACSGQHCLPVRLSVLLERRWCSVQRASNCKATQLTHRLSPLFGQRPPTRVLQALESCAILAGCFQATLQKTHAISNSA